MRVLIIEDRAEVREILKYHLNRSNIEVKECSSGNEAISIFRAGETFDLAISDYQMPNGDGLDVMKYLANSNAEIPLILFTSFWGLEITISYPPFIGLISKNDIQKLLSTITLMKEKLL